jgi:hypothetical protein
MLKLLYLGYFALFIDNKKPPNQKIRGPNYLKTGNYRKVAWAAAKRAIGTRYGERLK